ncbi:MAG: TRAP transporter small permease subunit [Fusobacteriaceae bacterium]|jgi:TRAP-type C4-dicarboxylate transport system permease small subunit|nr:TRAP transporter small permease subunit [Fusobacteriaceae bacterium]
MALLKKIDALVAKFLKIFVFTLFSALGLLLLLRVVIRYVPLGNIIPLFASTGWSDEIVEMLIAWTIFTTSSIIMRDNAHFRVDLIELKVKNKTVIQTLNVLISLMGVVFFGALVKYSYGLFIQATWTTSILKISQRVPYASIFFNAILMFIYLLRDLITGIGKLVKR